MAKWRLAKSLETLRSQINAAYPDRSKASDGTVGDTAHSSRESDHNPNDAGVVTAFDCTHDPVGGCNGHNLAAALVASRDERIKYIIFNKQMVSSYPAHGKPAWAWRAYNGANPHKKHVHISVKAEKDLYDSTDEWDLGLEPDEPEVAPEVAPEAVPSETTSEKVITTTTTETPTETVEKKSIIEKAAGNTAVKQIAEAGVSKLGNRVATGLATGSATSVISGFFERNMGLIIFGCVLIFLSAAIVGVVLWHRSTQQKKVIEVNSDRSRDDVKVK